MNFVVATRPKINNKEKKMRQVLSLYLCVIASFCSATALADNQEFTGGLNPDGAINLQAQLCKLNSGKTMAQYDKMINDYFKWSVKHDAEVTFVRQIPLFTHSNSDNPWGYDFVEFLVSSHSDSGKAWDKWLTTPDGQKLNATWQSLAKCDVKMGSVFFQYADVEALNNDRDRIVTWDWCTRKEGVSADQLIAKHDALAEEFSGSLGEIGWAVYYPQVGGANLPGDYAHITIYPDVEGLMKRQQWHSEGGWRAVSDYYASYADCTGNSANIETIMRVPGDQIEIM